MTTIITLGTGDNGIDSRVTINTNFSELNNGKEETIVTLPHEKGGLEANVSAYAGLVAISGGNTSQVNSKATLEAQMTDVTDFALANGDTYTGTHNFGGADDLEIPNSATPTVDTDGQIAIDTTVTDLSHGVIKYFAGEEMAVLAVPVAQLTGLTNGVYPAYNATNDELEFVSLPTLPPETTVKYKTASETVTSSTTLQDDDHLFFTIEANAKYALEGFLRWVEFGGHIKVAFEGTSSTTGFVDFHAMDSASTSIKVGLTDINDTPTSQTIVTADVYTSANIGGYISTGATGGTLQFQFAQGTSEANGTSLSEGCWLRLTKLN